MDSVADEERKEGANWVCCAVISRAPAPRRYIRGVGRPSNVVRFARSSCYLELKLSEKNVIAKQGSNLSTLSTHLSQLQHFPPRYHSGMRPVLLRRCHRLLSTPLYSCKRAPKSLRRPLIHNGFTARSLSTPHTLHQHDTLLHSEDTIFALSSAPGRAAIAIVRISGPACIEVMKLCTSIRSLNSASPW